MGYRNSVQSAHSSYMVLALGGRVRAKKGDERRLKGVAAALKRSGTDPDAPAGQEKENEKGKEKRKEA